MQQFLLQCGKPVGGVAVYLCVCGVCVCVCVCSPRLNEPKHKAAQLHLGVGMAIGAEMITHSRAACSGSKYHAHHQLWQLSLSLSGTAVGGQRPQRPHSRRAAETLANISNTRRTHIRAENA